MSERAAQVTDEEIVRLVPLVRRIAHNLSRRYVFRFVEFDDLASAGFVALVECAARYDASHGASFSTYVRTRIEGAMLDALGSRRRTASARVEFVSTDSPAARELPAADDMASRVEARKTIRTVTGRVVLTDRERDLLRRVYAHDERFADVATVWGIDKSGVTRTHARALDKLRVALKIAA